jgi:hypothetical protein
MEEGSGPCECAPKYTTYDYKKSWKSSTFFIYIYIFGRKNAYKIMVTFLLAKVDLCSRENRRNDRRRRAGLVDKSLIAYFFW